MRYDAVIFDMDGTVLDTTEDLRAALCHAFGQAGYAALTDITAEETKGFFGSGVRTAISRAFLRRGVTPDEAEISRVERIYRPYYDAHCADATDAYPGIRELLARLRSRAIPAAVVSNKPDGAVKELAARCFPGLFAVAVGEDERAGLRRKPAPDTTLYALREMGVPRERAVYVGDTEIDLATAEAAGTDCIAVGWGFRTREFLLGLGVRAFAADVGELERLLLGEPSEILR